MMQTAQAMSPDEQPSAQGAQATVMWAGDQIAVDMGQGPEPVDDIGAALQMVLDAYREASEGQPGEAAFAAAFSRDDKQADRQPSASDSAGARRY